jgi:DNA-binding transcriptional LysR family regulator
MIERLDIELLTTFVTIVDCKGFTRAATRLGRTQSSVSMQLKRLEERLGRRLIDRSARNARPTEEGYVLLEYARRIVDLSEEAELRMLAPRLAGRVRVGLPEWIAHDRLQMLLGRFNRAHPDVHLIVRVGSGTELRNAIAMGELDVALAIRPPDESGPAVHREPLLWVGARSICPKLQGEIPLALFSDPCPYRDLIVDTLTDAGDRVARGIHEQQHGERSWRGAGGSRNIHFPGKRAGGRPQRAAAAGRLPAPAVHRADGLRGTEPA